ncbi:hypothetical protein BM221_009165 [Beauveria bassiana]|uniref:Uncharacterized protein n=1 Tax=Beauveria bassiana TaxID=176275 RepID=A0A2N6NCI0_BEABA|nr:hypothetical protein BM221_009165 [Beauveria bassiana]
MRKPPTVTTLLLIVGDLKNDKNVVGKYTAMGHAPRMDVWWSESIAAGDTGAGFEALRGIV